MLLCARPQATAPQQRISQGCLEIMKEVQDYFGCPYQSSNFSQSREFRAAYCALTRIARAACNRRNVVSRYATTLLNIGSRLSCTFCCCRKISDLYISTISLSAELLKNIRRIDQGFPHIGVCPQLVPHLVSSCLGLSSTFMFMLYLHFTIMLM